MPTQSIFEFFVIEDFLSEDISSFLNQYTCHLYDSGKLRRTIRKNGTASWTAYGDPTMDFVLSHHSAMVSRYIGRDVLPTFSFVNHYRRGDILKIHRDRESSEIGISLTLGCSNPDNPWPLFFKTGEGPVCVTVRPGSAVCFEGRELPHWRSELQEDYFSVLNLCYVYADGSNAHHKYDGRESLGTPQTRQEIQSV